MKRQNTILKTTLLMIMIVVCTVSAQALPLDDAKEMVDNYYLYSQEKNVDAYVALFDIEYVQTIYGADYKDFFEEVLSYIVISDYKIDYQYYTESEDSLTLFFNLQSTVVVEGDSMTLDNDLVAFFSKTNEGIRLKYIMLQETFVEQMNREVMYMSAIKSMAEEQSNLKKEAEEKGIYIADYSSLFEDQLQPSKRYTFLWILLVILVAGIGFFIFKKEQSLQLYELLKKHSVTLYTTYYPRVYVFMKKTTVKVKKFFLKTKKHLEKTTKKLKK